MSIHLNGVAMLVVGSLCGFSDPSQAGQVEQAVMKATAQMQVSQGKLDGCGLRVLALAPTREGPARVADFSFNIYRSGMAAVKAGVMLVSKDSKGNPSTSTVIPIEGFWLKGEGSSPTTPNQAGYIQSDSPRGYLLYVPDVEAVSGMFSSFFAGRSMQVGYRLKGDDSDRILSGSPIAEESDRKEVSRCLGELANALKAE